MKEFTSNVKTIPYGDQRVFSLLSDLSNLERIQDRIPKEYIKDLSFDSDSCYLEVSTLGKVVFQIIDREPYQTIKFTTSNSPIPLFLWIQLKQVEENITKMKMTVRAELNPLLQTMVSKPMQEGLNKLADVIASLPYE